MNTSIDFKQELKKAKPTIVFYIVGFALVFILNKIDRGGPCNPGSGLIALLLLAIISFGLLIANIYKILKYGKLYASILLIHFIVWTLFSICTWLY